MSIHISAKHGEIAQNVLLAGDPLRAKWVADNFMDNARQVNSTRNAFYYTGWYKDKVISVGASGMGCPSIGIYSYELYKEYDVECIIRIGTCGAYREDIKLYDLINAERAFSESTYAKCAFGYDDDHFYHQGEAYSVINSTAEEMALPVLKGPIHSGDAFYTASHSLPALATKNNLLAAEMEAFALFANAKYLNKKAACLLTVSDNIVHKTMISPDERERRLGKMVELALESCLKFG
jgi:purine-nucleoside phosphorylase